MHVAEQGTARPDDERQAFDGFGHRAIVSGVDDGARGVADEIKQGRGRRLAIEFGEIGETAAAEQCVRKRCAAAP